MSGRVGGGDSACEGMLAELRKKHTVKSSQPLPARSTVGIVLEGTVVNIIVPGSPSYKQNEAGQCIEPGDHVVAIDGEEVTKADIIPKLRGTDVPGSPVTISVLKKDSLEPCHFKLTR
jgi:C-terminal processing protease CtpA/Prc